MQSELASPLEATALFANPRHAGRPKSGCYQHGVGGAVTSGALIELWVDIQADEVVQAHFEAFGCPSTIACGEWLCRWLIGRKSEAAARLTGVEMAETLALDAEKRSVALFAEDALKAALADCARNVSKEVRR